MTEYDGFMSTTIAELLRQTELGLRIRHASADAMRQRIDWATVSELVDPSPSLTGDELVLTAGVQLRTARACRTYVAAAAQAGCAGIGFGTGVSHDDVPRALLEAAKAAGVAVLEVPMHVSFAEITRYIAETNVSARLASLESQYRRRHHLVELLLGDGGLDAMLHELGRLSHAHFAVSVNGEVVSGALEIDDDSVTGWDALPIALADSTQATLHASRPRDDSAVNTARSLVGLHLSQTARRLHTSRQDAGHVIEELNRGNIAPDVAVSRLESYGFNPGLRYRTFVVASQASSRDEIGRMHMPSGIDAPLTALVEGRLVVFVPRDGTDGRIKAESISAACRAIGHSTRIGIGGVYPAADALRWGWFEAKDALTRLADGEEIGEAPALSMASLILSAEGVPVGELAERILEPLEDADTQGTHLIETLEAWISHSGAVAEVATALGTHRNTVRYRIGQIATLTGFDPRVTNDVVQLSLALMARKLSPAIHASDDFQS